MGGIRVDPDASMTDGLANMRNGCWIRWERRYQVALAALPLDLTVAYPYTHTREQKHTDAPPKKGYIVTSYVGLKKNIDKVMCNNEYHNQHAFGY